MDSIPPLRKCSKCKRELPATTDFFRKKRRLKYGLNCTCKECERKLNREYDKTPARKEQHRIKEQIRRKRPEIKEREKLRSEKRKDSRRIYNQKYVQTDAYREWDRARRKTARRQETARISFSKRRARKRELPDTLTTNDWERCLEYWGYKCAVCGKASGLWHVLAPDHWIPLSSPNCPGTIPTNIIPLCHSKSGSPVGEPCCNGNKHGKDAHDWLIKKLGKRKATKKLNEIEAYFKWVIECS